MYFLKLNENFQADDFSISTLKVSYGSKEKGLQYFNVDNKLHNLFNIIKEPFRNLFHLTFLEINAGVIPPHTDNNIKVSINFYIETNNCETTFYSLKDKNCQGIKSANQTNGRFYSLNDLNKEESFIAKNNDVYILNVTKPHGVISLENTGKNRTALCLQSPFLSFEKTLTVLNLEGEFSWAGHCFENSWTL
jgi:hypothetical protein